MSPQVLNVSRKYSRLSSLSPSVAMSRNPKRLLREISLIIHCPRGLEASANIKVDFPYDAIMPISDLLLTLNSFHELWWCAFVPFSRSGAHSHFQGVVLFEHKPTIWEESCENPQEGAPPQQLESEHWENTVRFCLFVCFHDSSCLSPNFLVWGIPGESKWNIRRLISFCKFVLAHDHSDMLYVWCWATLLSGGQCWNDFNWGFLFPSDD